MRDDFPTQTKTELAKGVGYRCSNPECRRATVGANAAQDGTITIGVAAHIRAASPGGPRFDALQTPEARRSKENGLWLCQSCSRLVDIDPSKFTVELLGSWKRDAQDRAFRELVAPNAAFAEEKARIEAAITADDARDADAEFDALFQKVRAAATADLASYKRSPIWTQARVELTLRIEGSDETPSFKISKLPLAIEVAPEVTIVAPPGTGKTTTLLQLAGHVLDANAIVPLYFRLADWSADKTGLLASLADRPSFKSKLIAYDHLSALAERGRLLLLLDGWNELDTDSRNRLRIEIGQIHRNWPNLRIIATTRQQMLDVPLSGPRIHIETLSEEQEMAIAEAGHGAAGVKIVDEAWRSPGLRQLIAMPLYLTSLLASGSRGAIPSTKDGVLRLFVQQHEQAADHAATLQSVLFGCHTAVLTGLAGHLNTIGSTTMTDLDARRIVTEIGSVLRQQGQIKEIFEPLSVLEALTSHHTLMRTGSGIAFQHQQFQEWYASNEVIALMRSSASGDASARTRLNAAILDQPAWEESVFFATELLAGESGGEAIVAHAIRLALQVDPMLAADMIYRANPAVWELLKDEVFAFVKRWHKPGTVDRAVRFMVMTGRPDFAPQVWPLASNDDSQIQIPTLRTAPRFRPSVLGPDLPAKLAKLPEKTRERLLEMIASESGVDGMDLAVELAKADPSPKVQAGVVQSLQFRRADRHVANLMSAAHDETWQLTAAHGYAGEIQDPSVASRLRTERQRLLEQTTDPVRRLHLLIEEPPGNPGRDAAIASIIASPEFPIQDWQNRALHLAQQYAPEALSQALKSRIEAGLELPFHTSELLENLDVVDEGPIAHSVLDVSRETRELNAAAMLAGPKTTAALLDKFLTCAKALQANRNNRALGEESQRIRTRIACTRPALFAAAVMLLGNTDDPVLISSLASLIAQHGIKDEHRKQPLQITPATKQEWVDLLRHWTDVVISAPDGRRHQLNNVSNAIGRLAFRELVPELKRLLDEELCRLAKAMEGYSDARRRGDIGATSDASMRYDNQYRDSFIRIGGDEVASVAEQYLESHEFGFSAAIILKAVSDAQFNLPAPDVFHRWLRFDDVATVRAIRADTLKLEPANKLANPIFAAIDRMAKPVAAKEDQLLAISLMRIALSMPHGNHDELANRVLALPQPLSTKRELAAAMVLEGLVLEADLVMRAIDEWLAEASDPKRAWDKRQNTWEIEPWLELLPFTTRPEAVLEGLKKVRAFYEPDWQHQWERVLDAVATVPGKIGDDLLTALAREHKSIAHDHTWMQAILDRGTSEAVLLYVDLYIAGILGTGRDTVDAWHVGQQLIGYVQKFPELRHELKKRYKESQAHRVRAILENFFSEKADNDDLIAMIKSYAANGQNFDGTVARAVECVTLDRIRAAGSSNSYNIYPASVAELRKTLFALLNDSPREAGLARRCLERIDHLRDEHGFAAGDPRHPDIMTGRHWPPETSAE